MGSQTIWKYDLVVTDDQRIALPEGAQPLCVQMQEGRPRLWALVTQSAPLRRLRVRIFGTGHVVDATGLVYIGTFQDPPLVFHVFAAWETD